MTERPSKEQTEPPDSWKIIVDNERAVIVDSFGVERFVCKSAAMPRISLAHFAFALQEIDALTQESSEQRRIITQLQSEVKEVRDALSSTTQERDVAQAIVDTLPKTADGVSITPGTTLFTAAGNEHFVYAIDQSGWCQGDDAGGCWRDGAMAYSTREAAEQAKESGDGR